MILFLQLLANGLVNGALFALLAVAFGLVYRSARIFHVAFGGLYVVFAYLLYAGVTWLSLPVWVAVLFTIMASARSRSVSEWMPDSTGSSRLEEAALVLSSWRRSGFSSC